MTLMRISVSHRGKVIFVIENIKLYFYIMSVQHNPVMTEREECGCCIGNRRMNGNISLLQRIIYCCFFFNTIFKEEQIRNFRYKYFMNRTLGQLW